MISNIPRGQTRRAGKRKKQKRSKRKANETKRTKPGSGAERKCTLHTMEKPGRIEWIEEGRQNRELPHPHQILDSHPHTHTHTYTHTTRRMTGIDIPLSPSPPCTPPHPLAEGWGSLFLATNSPDYCVVVVWVGGVGWWRCGWWCGDFLWWCSLVLLTSNPGKEYCAAGSHRIASHRIASHYIKEK